MRPCELAREQGVPDEAFPEAWTKERRSEYREGWSTYNGYASNEGDVFDSATDIVDTTDPTRLIEDFLQSRPVDAGSTCADGFQRDKVTKHGELTRGRDSR